MMEMGRFQALEPMLQKKSDTPPTRQTIGDWLWHPLRVEWDG